LLLQTFMSLVTSPSPANNAAILQLFLETYFIELLSVNTDAQETLSGDQQEALMTLIRSYLAGLANPLLAPPPCVEDFVLPGGPGNLERVPPPEQ